jgi:hypothetical protein
MKQSKVSEKYDHIDFKPPEAVANAAKKGLEYRAKQKKKDKAGLTNEEASKEGIGSGVQRAVNLKNRDVLSPKVVKQMKAFFSRHEKNKDIDPKYKDEPWKDNGFVSWLLWGGDPGKSWAEKIVNQMEKADMKQGKKASFQDLSMRWIKFLKTFHTRAFGSEYQKEARYRKLLSKLVKDTTRDLINGKLSDEDKLDSVRSFRKDLTSIIQQVSKERDQDMWNFGQRRYLSILSKFDSFFHDLRRMKMAFGPKERFLRQRKI